MIKKIIIIFDIVLCLSTMALAYAGDAGLNYDNGNLVSFNVQPHDYSIIVGEDVSFTLEITNKTDNNARIQYIQKVFEGSENQKYDIDIVIPPKETVDVVVTVPVLETLDWYKKNDAYYVDYKIKLFYGVSSEKNSEAWSWFSYQSNRASLLVQNMYDGTKIIDMTISENQKEALVIKDLTVFIPENYYYEYSAYVENDFKISNISDIDSSTIYKFIIFNNYESHEIDFPTKNETKDLYDVLNCSFYSKLSRVPQEVAYSNRAMIKVGSNYYITILENTYPTRLITPPDLLIEPYEENGQYFAKVHNKSSEDIYNLYIDLSAMHLGSEKDNYNTYDIPFIEAGEYSIISNDKIFADIEGKYIAGTKDEYGLALWGYGQIDYDTFTWSRPLELVDYLYNEEDLHPYLTPIPESTPTPYFTPEVISSPNISTPTSINEIIANENSSKITSRILIVIILILVLIMIIVMKVNNKNIKQKK